MASLRYGELASSSRLLLFDTSVWCTYRLVTGCLVSVGLAARLVAAYSRGGALPVMNQILSGASFTMAVGQKDLSEEELPLCGPRLSTLVARLCLSAITTIVLVGESALPTVTHPSLFLFEAAEITLVCCSLKVFLSFCTLNSWWRVGPSGSLNSCCPGSRCSVSRVQCTTAQGLL